jgi:hypothetical protein
MCFPYIKWEKSMRIPCFSMLFLHRKSPVIPGRKKKCRQAQRFNPQNAKLRGELQEFAGSVIRVSKDFYISYMWSLIVISMHSIYIYIVSVLIAGTVNKRISLNVLGKLCIWVFSLVQQIVLFGAFPREKSVL